MDALRRSLLPALLLAALAPAPAALASTGGTSVPANPPTVPMGQDGGIPAGADVEPMAAPKARAQMPTLVSFTLGARSFSDSGKGLPISFELAGSTGPVRVKLGVFARGRGVASFDLGRRATGGAQTYLLSPRSARRLPAGNLTMRLTGRDARGHHLRGSVQASAAHVVRVTAPTPPAPAPSPSGSHVFPLLGSGWSFGGADARFGAPRTGHTHQGQDVVAPGGTPIVAPAAGTVTFVAYQARGAGYYVVMHEAGQDYSYVFMHLLAGSTVVHLGQPVSKGQRIGSVGATGDATGPHLHFEIWQGPWQAGGHPIDPLPYLRQWAGA